MYLRFDFFLNHEDVALLKMLHALWITFKKGYKMKNFVTAMF